MAFENFGDDIIRAYVAGAQLRQQQEQLKLQRELLLLRQQQLEQEEKLKERELKRKEEEEARREKQARAKTIADYGKLVAQGMLQFPRRALTPAEIAEIVAFNAKPPDTRMPIQIPGFDDLQLNPEDFPENILPHQQFLQQQQKSKFEMQAQNQMALQELKHKHKLEELEKQFENQQFLVALRNKYDSSKERLALSYARFDQSKRDNVARAIQQGLRSKPLTDYFGASRAMYYLNTNAPDPEVKDFAQQFEFKDYKNGVRDLSLIYNYIRSLDESVVREGEINNLQKAASYLGKFGINIQRAVSSGIAPLLTPQQRMAIAEEIRKNYKAKKMAATHHVRSLYGIAKQFKPDITKEEFYSIVAPFVNSASEYNAIGIDELDIDDSTQRTPRNRQRVILVPKR